MHNDKQKWPRQLWVVRHGQSAGNIARDAAEAAGVPRIDINTRDMDVPLSPLGEQQARALGRWYRTLPEQGRPTTVLFSPYVRARQTANLIIEEAGLEPAALVQIADERLREKEFGVLDRLTRLGILQTYPELGEQRAHVGKFYFRPPGGESWCDVILRLRSMIDTIIREYRSENVLIVAHQVIVNCLRYLLERMTEQDILDIDRQADVPNCSVTSYQFDPVAGRNGKLVLKQVNFVAPLEQAGATVTSAPDMPTVPKS